MHCVLLSNPASGRNRSGRERDLERVIAALKARGHRAELAGTTGPGSAGMQAGNAVASGAEVVFACGGDGTVHEVMQGLVSLTGEPQAALGILPLGSANALARHLRLTLDPVEAALAQIAGVAESIPVGRLDFDSEVRYFLVLAGAGPDGALVHELLNSDKAALGRLAYYARALRLFLTQRFPAFDVSYAVAGTTGETAMRAVGAIAVRVGDLGGLFSGLADSRASLRSTHLRLLLVQPPAIISLPLWFVLGWLRMSRINPLLRIAEVREFSCRSVAGSAVHFEADGEWLGQIPMRASIRVSSVPDALRILVPRLPSPSRV